MLKSITDNVMNDESNALLQAICNNKTELSGQVTIEENPNSGWIYAADEEGICYLFNDSENFIIEQHISCPNCGYENFVSDFLKEAIDDCCKEYITDNY